MLAHDISLINVQASVALHLIDDEPEPGPRRADRHQGGQPRGAAASCAPTARRAAPGATTPRRCRRPPGLADLDELVARSTAGRPRRVEVVRTGDVRTAAAAVELAAYRIVQEALTNVDAGTPARAAAHRPPAATATRTRRRGDRRRSRPSRSRVTGDGHGIVGMRERAAALGGELERRTTARRRLPGRGPICLAGQGSTSMIRVAASPTTRRWCAAASARCSTRRPTSRSSARPADGDEAVRRSPRAPSRRRADGRADAGDATGWRRPGASPATPRWPTCAW